MRQSHKYVCFAVKAPVIIKLIAWGVQDQERQSLRSRVRQCLSGSKRVSGHSLNPMFWICNVEHIDQMLRTASPNNNSTNPK